MDVSELEQVIDDYFKTYGYPSADRLHKLLKKDGYKVTKKQITTYLSKKRVTQVHKQPAPKKKANDPIRTFSEHIEYQMDLLDFQKYSKENKGFKWILIVIDIFDRKLYTCALKTKSPNDVVKGLEKIFTEAPVPVVLASDDGKEWKGQVAKLMEKLDIGHKVAQKGDHTRLGIINRISRTIKNSFHKMFTDTEKFEWINYLEPFTKAYNNTGHTALKGITPNEAEQRHDLTFNIQYARVKKTLGENVPKMSFEVGDIVRVPLDKGTFGRGYQISFSPITYKVTKIDSASEIHVSDGKKYRPYMLQKVEEEDTQGQDIERAKIKEHRIEQIHTREDIRQENIVPRRSGRQKAEKVTNFLEKVGLIKKKKQ